MTDRLKGCTVTFDKSIREDDAESILNAIRMIKGVGNVSPSVDNFEDQMNRARTRFELEKKLWEVLRAKDDE